jgi:hypothetical protein
VRSDARNPSTIFRDAAARNAPYLLSCASGTEAVGIICAEHGEPHRRFNTRRKVFLSGATILSWNRMDATRIMAR